MIAARCHIHRSPSLSSKTATCGHSTVPRTCFSTCKKQEDDGDKESSSCSSPSFPWRHSHEPLERIVNYDDLSGMPLHSRARFVRSTLAARELNVPWIQILLTQSWKTKLAQDCAWAFQKGVAGLLSRTFHIPMEEIDSDSEGINVMSSAEKLSSWNEDEEKEADFYVNNIMEQNLRDVYSSVDPVSIELLLKMKPIDSRLENAFVVPMLTRDMVKEKPSMKGAYQKIEQEYGKSKDLSTVRKLGEKLAKETGYNGKRTVIADVSIDCLETFQVQDPSTGNVVRGNKEELKVTHLVRFEVVRSRKEKDPDLQLGSWQIIDWDDLVEGNVWH